MAERIYFAANNAEMGSGEVMLLALAGAARDLGRDIAVVGPDGSATLDAAWDNGFPVVAIKGRGRRQYMVNLRGWDAAAREGLLWCNGLVPAVATAGRRRRVLHVHLLPVGKNIAALRLARAGADAVVVPSDFVAARIQGARVLPNWVPPLSVDREPPGRVPATVGFLGRPSVAKGVVVLARAVEVINRRSPDRVRLLVAGEPLFVSQAERTAVDEALASLRGAVVRIGQTTPEAFFSRVDLAVFPSVVQETFGLVVAEAMSARVPFVVSDAGALPEIAGPAHPWVAPAGDVEALASIIETALDDWGSAALDQAHERWLTMFSPDAGREHLAAVLYDLDA